MQGRCFPFRCAVAAFFLGGFCPPLQAETDSRLRGASENETLVIQQQRLKALEQQLMPPVPAVRLSSSVSGSGRIAV